MYGCADYKAQSRTLDPVALELHGTRTTNINGQGGFHPCDLYG